MKNDKEVKQFLNNTIIINSIVWATVMVVSYLVLGAAYEKINLILLSGFFIEFMRYTSARNKMNRSAKKNEIS